MSHFKQLDFIWKQIALYNFQMGHLKINVMNFPWLQSTENLGVVYILLAGLFLVQVCKQECD